jgi:hypothetical protein
MRILLRAGGIVLLAVSMVGACSAESKQAPTVCADIVEPGTCMPAYEPTFANVFERTLRPSCGLGGAACHTSRGRQGGLVFEEAEEAYRGLLAGAVRAGDPRCSTLIVRLAARDPNVRMPPGAALAETDQCAVARWIADGAKR